MSNSHSNIQVLFYISRLFFLLFSAQDQNSTSEPFSCVRGDVRVFSARRWGQKETPRSQCLPRLQVCSPPKPLIFLSWLFCWMHKRMYKNGNRSTWNWAYLRLNWNCRFLGKYIGRNVVLGRCIVNLDNLADQLAENLSSGNCSLEILSLDWAKLGFCMTS